MKIKGIIFDFNGVLFWDTHLHDAAWRQYSKRVRGTELTDEEMRQYVHGRTNKDILEYVTGAALSSDDLQKHTEGKESTYRQLCLDEVENFILAPGAIELLDYLVAQSIPHTIATSSEIGNVTFFKENLHLDIWFDMNKVVYDDGKIAGKPAPDIYAKAVRSLNLQPGDCMVVEDSKSGIASARAVGIGEIVALGPKTNHTDLAETPGVTRVITDFYELLADLQKQNG